MGAVREREREKTKMREETREKAVCCLEREGGVLSNEREDEREDEREGGVLSNAHLPPPPLLLPLFLSGTLDFAEFHRLFLTKIWSLPNVDGYFAQLSAGNGGTHIDFATFRETLLLGHHEHDGKEGGFEKEAKEVFELAQQRADEGDEMKAKGLGVRGLQAFLTMGRGR